MRTPDEIDQVLDELSRDLKLLQVDCEMLSRIVKKIEGHLQETPYGNSYEDD